MSPRSFEDSDRRKPGAAPLALLLLLLFPPAAHAEWQNFRGSRDGLADNQVFSMLEDREGGMWFGTPSGASRYDGAHWLTYQDSLPNRTVLAMCQDRTGALWFGTQNGGVARFDGTRWRVYSATTGELPSNQVEAILEDHAGEMWFGTPNGLVRFHPQDGSWTTFTATPGTLVHSHAWRLLEDDAHNLWIATPEGASVLDSTRTNWRSFVEDPGALARDSVLALGKDLAGNVWLGTDRGVFRYANSQFTGFTTSDGLSDNVVTVIHGDRRGGVWFGSRNGLTNFDGRIWRATTTFALNQPLLQILELGEDASGNLWVATAAAGLFRYDGVGWSNYYSANTTVCPEGVPVTAPATVPAFNVLGSNCIESLLDDHAGEMWVVTTHAGARRFDRRGIWTSLRRSINTKFSDSSRVVFEDRGSRLWFGSEAAGVSVLDSARTGWSAYTAATELPSNNVLALFQDARGDVWCGTGSGVARFTGTQWLRYLPPPWPGRNIAVSQIVEDRAGFLWFRADSALYRLNPARDDLRPIGVTEGLAADTALALLLAGIGDLWCGTTRGLSVLSGGTWTSYRAIAGPKDNVFAIAEARDGEVWTVSDDGAVRFAADRSSHSVFPPGVLGSTPVGGLIADDLGTVWIGTFGGLARYDGSSWHNYNRRGDGLMSDQLTQFLEDHQGQLWFGSNRGLTAHAPDRTAPQTVMVSRPEDISTSRTASFVFGAGFGEASDLEFHYAFDGMDCGCWTPQVSWEGSGLADGVHTFEVSARDWTRNADPTPARFTFEIDATPPAPVLASPLFGQAVRGAVEVLGSTTDARFHDYRVELRPAGVASWTDPGVRLVASSQTPVATGTLGSFDSRTLGDGFYELRVTVTDTLGLVGATQIALLIDNEPPFAEVTSPARVDVLSGGDVFSTLGEMHLYFPPRAFREEALVTILKGVAPVPATLPSGGAAGLEPSYDIAWSPGPLDKMGTVDVAVPAAYHALDGEPAIYHQETDGGWTRLGGTLDRAHDRLAAAIRSPGRYAVFVESALPQSSVPMQGPECTPRVFSPGGRFASSSVAISFVIGRTAPTTVKVFNRSGRMVRELVGGTLLGAGQNLVRWDGRDAGGRLVEDGIYLVSVEALGETRTKSVAVVR